MNLKDLVPVFLVLVIAGCESTTGGSDDTNSSVDEALVNLGVDIDTSPREYEDGTAIPATENPLGRKVESVNALQNELAIVGFGDFFQILDDDITIGPDPTSPMFQVEKGNDSIPDLRVPVGVAANVNGNNYKEAIFAGVPGIDPNPEITLISVSNLNGVHTEQIYNDVSNALTGSEDYISDVQDIAAGDVDLDGRDEIAIVYRTTENAFLILLDDEESGFNLLDSYDFSWNKSVNPTMKLRVDMGDVDLDGNQELAVLYSITDDTAQEASGTSTIYIFDVVNTVLVEKHSTLAQADIGGGAIKEIMFGDISLGDIDGDGFDEVVVGGVEKVHLFSVSADVYFLQIAFDDAERDFVEIDNLYDQQLVNDPVEEPYVEMWDYDGDGVFAIQVHGHLYEDFRTSGGVWEEHSSSYDLQTMLGLQTSDEFTHYMKSTAAMATGDLDSDGKEELILSANNGTCINIIEYTSTNVFEKADFGGWTSCQSGNSPVNGNTISSLYSPVLLPVDFDGDAFVVEYVGREVTYTEPLIIAALAAPPCFDDVEINQSTSECVTSYGKGHGKNDSNEFNGSFSVGVGVGFEAKAFSTGVEVDLDFTQTLSLSKSWSTEVEQTITYTSSPMTDSVIFTTVPSDHYKYTVINDPEKPENNGEILYIDVPRAIQTYYVTREFYNANTLATGPKVSSSVFNHTIGNPFSYPTSSEAQSWILEDDENGLIVDNPIAVTQTGYGEIELSSTTSTSTGTGWSRESEATIETTVGASVKATLGFGVGADISWGFSDTFSVTGSVGAIEDSTQFSENPYTWGIGSYSTTDPLLPRDIEFVVVNYWVDPG